MSDVEAGLASICVVSVTYGRRADFVMTSLAAAFKEGVRSAVIVDNASIDFPSSTVEAQFQEKVQVVRMSENAGSADGFGTGIRFALDSGADFVLLLDDDNRLEVGALSALRRAYLSVVENVGMSRLAVSAFRSRNEEPLSSRARIWPAVRKNGFLGFHVLDVPSKILKRIGWHAKNRRSRKFPPSYPRLECAPYGGLLFHRDLISVIGFPERKYFLYGDDMEFTFRITEMGGAILFVADAEISDLERSWHRRADFGNSFESLLMGEGDSRAFYATRNRVHFEMHRYPGNRLVRSINRCIYICILGLFSIKYGATDRFRILREAIRAGEREVLGIDERFSL